jgi:predicted nucleic acid-binding protein
MHYVDTSVLVAYFVPEIYSANAETALRDSRRYPLALSEWTATEFVSALGIKCRTGQLNEAQSLSVQRKFKALTDFFEWLPVETEDFRQAHDWLGNWRLGLRSGDALHLAISHRSGHVLITLDDRLARAAGTLQIPAELIR